MYNKFDSSSKQAVLCLDAEKAFDQVEWGYLLKVLEEFGLGASFISWVRLIYAHPTASILTNQDRSTPFALQRGTRQGCPLSPLLFALAIEPLAISIRGHALIKPITLGGMDHKISLYADDIAIFVSDPENSVPHLLQLIDSFGEVSGYTINWQKSELLSLTADLDPTFLANTQFKTNLVSIKYLGIKLSKNPKTLFKINFMERLNKLKENVEKWRTLPISLIGRVNAIKMVSLPRFLYLFQNVPIYIPKSYFKSIDSIIMPFIWGYKSHRISKAHLQKPREHGGLGLPCFLHYYWAANARVMVYWQFAQEKDVRPALPPWLAIEKSLTPKTSLTATLFSSPRPLASFREDHFTLSNGQRIWNQIRKACELRNTSIHAPIWHNHAFPPSFTDSAFKDWSRKGIVTVEDLYINGHFASFDQLVSKFSLSKTQFFRYLQLRNYVRQNIPSFESLPADDSMSKILLGSPEAKNLISSFVGIFLNQQDKSTLKIKQTWERDLNIEISDDVWEGALKNIKSCSINSRLQLIQFKVTLRLHYSKVKLHNFFPNLSPLCNRCKIAEGTLAHHFWDCPNLYNFWCLVFQWYSTVLNVSLTPDPETALFGHSTTLENLDHNARTILVYGMVIAKRCILKLWKSDSAPQFDTWLSELMGILHVERLRYDLSGNSQKFLAIWNPVLQHIKD